MANVLMGNSGVVHNLLQLNGNCCGSCDASCDADVDCDSGSVCFIRQLFTGNGRATESCGHGLMGPRRHLAPETCSSCCHCCAVVVVVVLVAVAP